MRPYLEVEVVKAKRPHTKVIKFTGGKYVIFIEDGKVSIKRHKHQAESNDNYVNGENLDKIKFPCFCQYNNAEYAIITKTYLGFDKKEIYTLHYIRGQSKSLSSIKSYDNLEKLIKAFDIHIIKGKIILFEEE